MKPSDIIQQMHDAGAPIEAILIAVRALEARDEADEARKAAQRDRKRRQRAKEQDGSVTVTGQSRDMDGTEQDTPLSPSPNENNSNPHPHTPVNNTPARKGTDFPKLDCAEPQLWRDFLKNRKAKRLPNTPSAHEKLEQDLARWSQETGWPPGEVFKACVQRGWGAIYDPREAGKSGGSNDNRRQGNSNSNTARLALQKLGMAGD